MKDENEKRKFTRVPFKTRAMLKTEQESIEGEVENISLQGMLLKTDQTIDTGKTVDVMIALTGSTSNLSFLVTGKVVRVQDHGIGIQFDLDKIPFDSLTHLRYMVSYNLGDFDIVMNEYFEYLSLKT